MVSDAKRKMKDICAYIPLACFSTYVSCVQVSVFQFFFNKNIAIKIKINVIRFVKNVYAKMAYFFGIRVERVHLTHTHTHMMCVMVNLQTVTPFSR